MKKKFSDKPGKKKWTFASPANKSYCEIDLIWSDSELDSISTSATDNSIESLIPFFQMEALQELKTSGRAISSIALGPEFEANARNILKQVLNCDIFCLDNSSMQEYFNLQYCMNLKWTFSQNQLGI